MVSDLFISSLNVNDADDLNKLINFTYKQHSKYFTPFNNDSLLKILKQVKLDKYFAIHYNNKLIGFFMLRGFDEGYKIPSYGVWILPQYTNKGIAKLTLQYAVTFCKINNIPKLMLKVHPENNVAKDMYLKYGFVITGKDEKNDNIILHKDI